MKLAELSGRPALIRVAIATAVLGATAFGGCKRESAEPRFAHPDQTVVLDVVARVGATSIGASEVANRMAADGLGAEAVIEQLIKEAVLVQEAERSGVAASRDGQLGIERLMVRTMLRDLEKENTPESISGEELREAYALNASEFQVPERRRSWHLLVQSQSEAAEALAESILRELQRAEDPRTVYDRYADGAPGDGSLQVKAEELPAITEKASLKKAYKNAVFGAKSEGPVKNVIQTSYGWHAIVVSEILPGDMRTFEEVETELRERLSQQRRLGAIVAIVQGLEAEGLVRYDEQGVQRLLSMPGLPKRAE
ncbi:MAG: peptidyl-prolyl cis-trans isomerase [Deltaproteobacteria bacterium]|nr:peptidyl-prolyl cis-trans isomerase [Deltaproteobacteria bacterium]